MLFGFFKKQGQFFGYYFSSGLALDIEDYCLKI